MVPANAVGHWLAQALAIQHGNVSIGYSLRVSQRFIAVSSLMDILILSDPNPVSDPTASQPAASRLGLCLFAAYTLLYLGFVFINAFSAETMETIVVAGLNLAIVYGFGLIIAAIVLAFIYGFATKDPNPISSPKDTSNEASTDATPGASS